MGKSHLALIFHVYCMSVLQFSYLLASIALWGGVYSCQSPFLKAQLSALPGKNELSDFWNSSTFPPVVRATHTKMCLAYFSMSPVFLPRHVS